MTVEECMTHINGQPNVKLLSAYDGRVVAPAFHAGHKDYDFIKDMSVCSMFAKIETDECGSYATLTYCIYLHLDDVEKILEHRRNERIASRARKVERAKKIVDELQDEKGA